VYRVLLDSIAAAGAAAKSHAEVVVNRLLAVGLAGAGLAGFGLVGCGSSKSSGQGNAGAAGDSNGRVCAPGATQTCVGPGACSGGQQCLPDGSSWGACQCGIFSGFSGSGGTDGSGGGAISGNGGSAMMAGNGGNAAAGSSVGGNASGGGCQINPTLPFTGTVISDFLGAEPLKVQGVPKGGSWLGETDGTGTIALTVELSPDAQPLPAMHFVGSNHVKWGGDVAVMFVDAATPVDVHAFTGVTFKVRGTISGGVLFGKLQNVDSLVLGCGCDPSPFASEQTACYGGFIKEGSVLSTWTDNALPFNAFQPSPSGYHAKNSFDPGALVNFAIVVQAIDPVVSWDLWISGVKFF